MESSTCFSLRTSILQLTRDEPKKIISHHLCCVFRQVSKLVQCFNMDARAFFRDMRSRQRSKAAARASNGDAPKDGDDQTAVDIPEKFDHVVMNLPATALEFLGALCSRAWNCPD